MSFSEPDDSAGADWPAVAEVLAHANAAPVTDPERAAVAVMVKARAALRAEAGFIVVAMHVEQGAKRGAPPPVDRWVPVAFFDDPDRSEARARIHDAFLETREYVEDASTVELIRGAGRLRAHRNRELIPQDVFARTPTGVALALLGVRDRIVGSLPLTPTLEMCVGFDRAAAAADFDERDRHTLIAILGGSRVVWARLARVLGLLGATETLTPREREVVRALLKGHAEAEIAELVGMTTRSAHQRIVAIYRKLGVRTRAELTALVLDGASCA